MPTALWHTTGTAHHSMGQSDGVQSQWVQRLLTNGLELAVRSDDAVGVQMHKAATPAPPVLALADPSCANHRS